VLDAEPSRVYDPHNLRETASRIFLLTDPDAPARERG
jgi:hypothetical protein